MAHQIGAASSRRSQGEDRVAPTAGQAREARYITQSPLSYIARPRPVMTSSDVSTGATTPRDLNPSTSGSGSRLRPMQSLNKKNFHLSQGDLGYEAHDFLDQGQTHQRPRPRSAISNTTYQSSSEMDARAVLITMDEADPVRGMRSLWVQDRITRIASLWNIGPEQKIGPWTSQETRLITTKIRTREDAADSGTGGDTSTVRGSLLEGYKRLRNKERDLAVGRVIEVVQVPLSLSNGLEQAAAPTRPRSTGVRHQRYVVIASPTHRSGFFKALPIRTYDGRGVTIPGVSKAHHCILYTESNRSPEPTEEEKHGAGEPPLRTPAILVEPYDRSQSLNAMARLNFFEIHEISCIYPFTKMFGKIHGQHLMSLTMYFRAVWSKTKSRPLASLSTLKDISDSESSLKSSISDDFGISSSTPSGPKRVQSDVTNPNQNFQSATRRINRARDQRQLNQFGHASDSARLTDDSGKRFTELRTRVSEGKEQSGVAKLRLAERKRIYMDPGEQTEHRKGQASRRPQPRDATSFPQRWRAVVTKSEQMGAHEAFSTERGLSGLIQERTPRSRVEELSYQQPEQASKASITLDQDPTYGHSLVFPTRFQDSTQYPNAPIESTLQARNRFNFGEDRSGQYATRMEPARQNYVPSQPTRAKGKAHVRPTSIDAQVWPGQGDTNSYLRGSFEQQGSYIQTVHTKMLLPATAGGRLDQTASEPTTSSDQKGAALPANTQGSRDTKPIGPQVFQATTQDVQKVQDTQPRSGTTFLEDTRDEHASLGRPRKAISTPSVSAAAKIKHVQSLMSEHFTMHVQLVSEEQILQGRQEALHASIQAVFNTLEHRNASSARVEKQVGGGDVVMAANASQDDGIAPSASYIQALTETYDQRSPYSTSALDDLTRPDSAKFDILESNYQKYMQNHNLYLEQQERASSVRDNLRRFDYRLDRKIQELCHLLDSLTSCIPSLHDPSLKDLNIQPDSPTDSVSEPSKSETPSLLAHYFDRVGDIGVYQERLMDLVSVYHEDLVARDLLKDRGDEPQDSDEKFESEYQTQRQEILADLETAGRDASALKEECLRRGYDTAPKRRVSMDVTESSSTNMEHLVTFEPPLEGIPRSRVLSGTASQSSSSHSQGNRHVDGWLAGLPAQNIVENSDPLA